MGKNKVIVTICALALLLTMGMSTLMIYASDESSISTVESNTELGDPAADCAKSGKKPKDESNQKFKDFHEKWSALSDKQKAEVFDLVDDIADDQIELLDKLVEFKVLDEETACEIKAKMGEKIAAIKAGSAFFGLGFGRGPKKQKSNKAS